MPRPSARRVIRLTFLVIVPCFVISLPALYFLAPPDFVARIESLFGNLPQVTPELRPLIEASEREAKTCREWAEKSSLNPQGAPLTRELAQQILAALKQFPGPNRSTQMILTRVVKDFQGGSPDLVAALDARECAEIFYSVEMTRLIKQANPLGLADREKRDIAAAALAFIRSESAAPSEMVMLTIQVKLLKDLVDEGLWPVNSAVREKLAAVDRSLESAREKIRAKNADLNSPNLDEKRRPTRAEAKAMLESFRHDLEETEKIRAGWRSVIGEL